MTSLNAQDAIFVSPTGPILVQSHSFSAPFSGNFEFTFAPPAKIETPPNQDLVISNDPRITSLQKRLKRGKITLSEYKRLVLQLYMFN